MNLVFFFQKDSVLYTDLKTLHSGNETTKIELKIREVDLNSNKRLLLFWIILLKKKFNLIIDYFFFTKEQYY